MFVLVETNTHMIKKDQSIGTERKFCCRINDIYHIGLKNWPEKETIWPISPKESMDIVKSIDALYIKQITDLPRKEGDLLLILYKVIVDLYMYAHHLILHDRIQGKCYQDQCSYKFLFQKDNRKLWPALPYVKNPVKREVRVLYHKIKNIFRHRSSDKSVLCVDNPSKRAIRYFERIKNKWSVISPLAFAESAKDIRSENSSDYDYLTSQLIKDFLSVVNPRLSSSNQLLDTSELKQWLREIVQETLRTKDILTQALQKIGQQKIFISGLGVTWKRCLARAAKDCGYQVIGLHHGNNSGIMNNNIFAMIDLALIDTYIVPTKGAQALFEKTAETYIPEKYKKLSIVSIDSSRYKKWDKLSGKESLPNKIKKIMILEYPMTEMRHREEYTFWPFQLHLLKDLSQFFQQTPYHTILKRHPDRLKTSEGLYDGMFDEIVTEKFEDIWHKADAHLLTYLSSTTFGFSLMSNRPIFIFDVCLKGVWREVEPFLKKRCKSIPSKYTEDGWLEFNQENFLNLLKEPVRDPDKSYGNKYMF